MTLTVCGRRKENQKEFMSVVAEIPLLSSTSSSIGHQAGAGEDTRGDSNMRHAMVVVATAVAAHCQDHPPSPHPLLLSVSKSSSLHQKKKAGGAPLSRGGVFDAFEYDDECDNNDDDNNDDRDDGIIGGTGVGCNVGATKRVVHACVYFISQPDWLFEPNPFIPNFPTRKGRSEQRYLYQFSCDAKQLCTHWMGRGGGGFSLGISVLRFDRLLDQIC